MTKKTRLPRDPAKKERMLAAALALFAKHGYTKTTMDKVAQQAAVSKGLVFKYFGDKELLYLAVLKKAYADLLANLDWDVWQQSTDLVEMVVNATRYKMSVQLQHPDEFNVLLSAFVHQKQLPSTVATYVQQVFISNSQLTTKLVAPVLSKMDIKPGISQQDVMETIGFIVNGYTPKLQEYMLQHPEVTELKQMEPMIAELTHRLRILEYGFAADQPRPR